MKKALIVCGCLQPVSYGMSVVQQGAPSPLLLIFADYPGFNGRASSYSFGGSIWLQPGKFGGTILQELEELGIGRPSTYAPTISTILNRGYVEKGDRTGSKRDYTVLTLSGDQIGEERKSEVYGKEKAKLFPTDIGGLVNDFLVNYFSNILDYNFTANIEKEFDKIAEGEIEWTQMINRFYPKFHFLRG